MTQKDSEDDTGDGLAPQPAEARPAHSEPSAVPVPETIAEPEPAPLAEPHAAAEREEDAEHSASPPPTSAEPSYDPPQNDDASAGPYRPEYATFVTLPATDPAPYSASALAQPEAPAPVVPDVVEPEPEQPSFVAGPPTDEPVEVVTAPPAHTVPESERLPPASNDADEQPAAPYTAAQAPPVIVRRAWDRPPPIVETPPWVWRDVVPDIVERPAEDPPEARAQPEPPTTEPPADLPAPSQQVSAPIAPPHADPEPEALEVPTPDPAARYEALVPRDMPFDIGADRETLPSPPAPQPTEASEPAPEPLPPPAAPIAFEPLAAPPRASAQPISTSRIEPEWQRPPSHAMFQDARPGEHARDGFAAPPATDLERYKGYGRTALRYAGYAIGGYFALVFALILLYRVVNPPASSLMLAQALTGTDVRQEWVPLDEISPALVRAVIVSEDWSFCAHYGIDINAIEQAIEKSGNGIPRGASTISMQTTKNLFLWNAKSYIRKAVELPLTLMIELIWPKSRILEIYLNVAEWGPGIFGAEAAAQYHFNKPASRLGEREAAQLAASLPNPIIREAGDPGPQTARKATVIQSRMRNAGGAAACVLRGR